MYIKSGHSSTYPSNPGCDHFEGTFGLVSSSSKMLQRKFAKVSCSLLTSCMLFFAGTIPAWAHGGGGGFHGGGCFHGGGFGGGGFHEGGFGGHGGYYSHGYGSGMSMHQTHDFYGSYRGSDYGSIRAPSYGHFGQTTHNSFQGHSQSFHSFNLGANETHHFNSFQHNGYAGGFSGHANYGYWHGGYGHGGYWHGGNWHGGYWNGGNWHGGYWNGYGHYWGGGGYWGPWPYWGWGPYWGWDYGFFYGAFFGATITTALFYPPFYADYYYAPMDYYPGPYDYTVLVNDYSAVPTTPLRAAPQKVETWVPVKNGHIPSNAVTNKVVNKKATYYCRVKFRGKTSYGVLVPNDGCYVEAPSVTMRFSKYDVLVSSTIG